MSRIIFTLLLLSLFTGGVIAQQQKGESLKVMKSERLEYQNEATHFITDTYYGMLLEAVESTEAHSEFIALLMQEDEVKYMPEFVSDYSAQRYMDPTQYFGCLHRTFSAYNPNDLMFSVENMLIYDDFYRYGLRGCYIRAEYDLEIKWRDKTLSKKRCRMYCLFPNSGTKKIIKVMQLEPIKDLMSANNAESDAEESLKKLLKKAESGDYHAQFELGKKYYVGDGVVKNYAEAMKWYRKSAEQGNAEAQAQLGFAYMVGQGVPQNKTEGAKWYRKAADKGIPVAQFGLGSCYMNGFGVPRNVEEGVKWYRKAAESGAYYAEVALGECYENGEGVVRDYQEALKWYSKAAAQGNEKAKSRLADLNSQLSKNNENKNVTESDATHEWVRVSFDTPLLFHEGTIILQRPTEVNAQLRKFYTEVLAKQQFPMSIVGYITQAESVAGKFSLALQRAKNIESILNKHGFLQHCEVITVTEPLSGQNAEVEIFLLVSKNVVKNALND